MNDNVIWYHIISLLRLNKEFSKVLDALDNRNNIISAIFGNGLFLLDIKNSYHVEQWISKYAHTVEDWFEVNDNVPFMMKVIKVKASKRNIIEAVTHVDGSGRLQTVYKKTNPRYHALISEFYLMTGVPILLNTSFNENEPVVCNPKEALDCFLRTKMDVLVLNDYFISRG